MQITESFILSYSSITHSFEHLHRLGILVAASAWEVQ